MNLTQIPSPNIRRFSVAELFDRISILYQAKLKGVSMSRQIMMLHNGQIEVKSGSGENTTFTLVF